MVKYSFLFWLSILIFITACIMPWVFIVVASVFGCYLLYLFSLRTDNTKKCYSPDGQYRIEQKAILYTVTFTLKDKKGKKVLHKIILPRYESGVVNLKKHIYKSLVQAHYNYAHGINYNDVYLPEGDRFDIYEKDYICDFLIDTITKYYENPELRKQWQMVKNHFGEKRARELFGGQ